MKLNEHHRQVDRIHNQRADISWGDTLNISSDDAGEREARFFALTDYYGSSNTLLNFYNSYHAYSYDSRDRLADEPALQRNERRVGAWRDQRLQHAKWSLS
jgi:hypothetical protein